MFNPFKINSCDGYFYDSVDVRFTKQCDNNCAFCIEKDGIKDQNQNVKEMIKTTIEQNKKEILILGGEPFINVKKLHEYIFGIRNNIEKIFITTSLPKTIDLNNPLIHEILDTIDGLNVSIQSIDYEVNNQILKAASNHNRLDILKELNIKWKDKIRTSINLVNGGIDSKEKLLNSLSFLYNIGCKNIKINELQEVSIQQYINFENIMNIKMKSPYAFGCQTNISNMFDFNGLNITLKRSCFQVQPKEARNVNIFDFFKFLIKTYFISQKKQNTPVIYEDGSLKSGWIKSKKEEKTYKL
jgi:organic radical activating enzyme